MRLLCLQQKHKIDTWKSAIVSNFSETKMDKVDTWDFFLTSFIDVTNISQPWNVNWITFSTI